ncbi:MAG: ligase [Herminiimonas sp.]|nr:ligase [Herminiimonas sp.]
MTLHKYWDKRDFTKTSEPRGKTATPGEYLSFTIQKHHARRLHYDFRLELGGTLKSWAIPKGPSLNPADKRLAVHVEDHPLEYGSFEGDIPEHEYGAGHVIVWDTGIWVPDVDPEEGYRKGNLKFHLYGEKLSGGWALVRMGRQEESKENWLLVKERDEEARSGPEADIVTLMPDSVLANRKAANAGAKSAAKSPAKTSPRAATKSATESATESPTKSATKSAAKSATKSTIKPTTKAAIKATAKSVPVSALKTAGKTAAKRVTESVVQKAGKPAVKPATGLKKNSAPTPAPAKKAVTKSATKKVATKAASMAAATMATTATAARRGTTRADAIAPPLPPKAAPATTRAARSSTSAKSPLPADLQAALDAAPRAALPQTLSPQLATLADQAPSGDDWLSEIKFDGYRAVCRIDSDTATIFTRAGNDWTDKWEAIATAAAQLPLKQAWLDGEVVALDEEGNVSFQLLQNMAREGRKARLAYYVFDLAFLDGHDLRGLPLSTRKALLQALMSRMPVKGPLLYSDHLVGNVNEAWQHACMHGLEGIVTKRADGGYSSTRSRGWLKLKCQKRQEFVVGGYTDPAGSREQFGALLLGVYDDAGKLQYAGRVGTGFDDATLRAMGADFRKLASNVSPFATQPPRSGAPKLHWLKPEMVAEVKFAEWTGDGVIRHASFVGLRSDKAPRDITHETAVHVTGKGDVIGDSDATGNAPVGAQAASNRSNGKAASTAKSDAGKELNKAPSKKGVDTKAASKKTKAATTVESGPSSGVGSNTTDRSASSPEPAPSRPAAGLGKDRDAEVAGVRISHPSRILYADTDITKLMLARYYEEVGEQMLPHLAGRPLTLVRCPQGAAHQCFFQKHANETTPPDIERIDVSDAGGSATYLTASTLTSLIGTVQMGVLELHTWGSSAPHLDKPDRIIFDLDPAPELDWARVVEAAQLVRGFMQELGLESFVKTTGGKGLHVVVPIKPERTWDEIKPFSRAVAEHFEAALPDRFTSKMTKTRRTGRIFIDYLRNGWEATAVAAFSTRSRPGAPVSVPIAWDELSNDIRDNSFTLLTVGQRLKHLAEDPWKDYFTSRQRVTAKMLRALGMATP